MLPAHNKNPIQITQPLIFFHCAAWSTLAIGMGALITSPFSGSGYALWAISGILGFVSIHIGIKLAIKWNHDKVTEE